MSLALRVTTRFQIAGARSVPTESARALDSLFGAYSYRRTGTHFAGICALFGAYSYRRTGAHFAGICARGRKARRASRNSPHRLGTFPCPPPALNPTHALL